MKESTPIRTAVRAYATIRDSKRSRKQKPASARKRAAGTVPQRTIVLDCETGIDAAQALIFGVARYFVDRRNQVPCGVCNREVIFYADDLPDLDPDAFATLCEYVESARAAVAPGRSPTIQLRTRTQFVRELTRHGTKLGATIVGFNLPFDLSRFAVGWAPARGNMYGGFSLQLSENERYVSRIVTRSLDSKRAFIQWRASFDQLFRAGRFVDLRAFSYTLTGEPQSLETASAVMAVPYVKRDVTHGVITKNYVSYCREDVSATVDLYRALVSELRQHPVDLEPANAYSPASIAKAYLRAMGIRPVLERQPDFPTWALAWGMEAFYGGRAEARIRKVPVPVTYVDFRSMYPTVNTLMRSWRLTTAERIELVDATDEVRRLLDEPDLADRFIDPEEWPQLLTLVEVEPHGATLPVRAKYEPGGDFGIGVNPLMTDSPRIYALGDLVAACILGAESPHVLLAWRLVAHGQQDGLRPVAIRGGRIIDPATTDFFKCVIESRVEAMDDQTLSPTERYRLATTYKVLANSASYGVNAEFVTRRHSTATPVDLHTTDGGTVRQSVIAPEDPGEFCFPPMAACITASARLMLALVQLEVSRRGGSFAMCDTDSLAIVSAPRRRRVTCPTPDGTSIVALSHREVQEIVARFEALSPYDKERVPGSILKVEDVNIDERGQHRTLWCFAIAAKRYVLFTRRADGSVDQILKRSEHGLGHLMNPRRPDGDSTHWIDDAWRWTIDRSLGVEAIDPDWFDLPALTRITVSGPMMMRLFTSLNATLPADRRVRPHNFILLGHLRDAGPMEVGPVAPYETDPSRWLAMRWIDRQSGKSARVSTEGDYGSVSPGVLRIRSFRSVLDEFSRHPESKSLGPDGSECSTHTTGLLGCRPVVPDRLVSRIGKEANLIDERLDGVTVDPSMFRTVYDDGRFCEWEDELLPMLRDRRAPVVARAIGVNRRTIQRYQLGTMRPRKSTMDKVRRYLTKH